MVAPRAPLPSSRLIVDTDLGDAAAVVGREVQADTSSRHMAMNIGPIILKAVQGIAH